MAKYPFEYQNYLKNKSIEQPADEKPITGFIIGEKMVDGELILEKNSTSIKDNYTNISVYKLPLCEDVGFYGTPFNEIQKEFPDKKFSAEDIMCYTYLMFKDENAVLEYDYD